jgi:hypothetical protein
MNLSQLTLFNQDQWNLPLNVIENLNLCTILIRINVTDILEFFPSDDQSRVRFIWASEETGWRHLYLVKIDLLQIVYLFIVYFIVNKTKLHIVVLAKFVLKK